MSKKTIKFYDKDAADHKFGEGGGGFVVNFTKNAQNEVTCDKTFAEIMEKITAGNDVIGYVTGADGMTYAMLPTIKAGTSGVVFSSTFYDNDNKGIVYQVECYQSEGHDFFEWSVVELAGGGGDTPVEIALTEENVDEYNVYPIGDHFFGIALVFVGELENNKKISIKVTTGDNIYRWESQETIIADGLASILFFNSFGITEEQFLSLSPKLVIS